LPLGTEYSEEELEVVRRYTGYAAELATYGKPTGGNPEKVYDLEWEPYQKGNGQVSFIKITFNDHLVIILSHF